jgi:hypothetical protein
MHPRYRLLGILLALILLLPLQGCKQILLNINDLKAPKESTEPIETGYIIGTLGEKEESFLNQIYSTGILISNTKTLQTGKVGSNFAAKPDKKLSDEKINLYHFLVALPVGDYTIEKGIAGWYGGPNAKGTIITTPNVNINFTVKPKEATYLGRIIATSHWGRNILSSKPQAVHFTISDALEEDREDLMFKFAELDTTPISTIQIYTNTPSENLFPIFILKDSPTPTKEQLIPYMRRGDITYDFFTPIM